MAITKITLEIKQGEKEYKATVKPDKDGRLSAWVFIKGEKSPIYGTSFGSNYNDIVQWVNWKCKTHSEGIKEELFS